MAKKETCPRCGQSNFSVAADKSGKHYCQVQGCGHVWVPGIDGLKRPDVVIKKLQEENMLLAVEIAALRKENKELKAKIGPKQDEAEEIFS